MDHQTGDDCVRGATNTADIRNMKERLDAMETAQKTLAADLRGDLRTVNQKLDEVQRKQDDRTATLSFGGTVLVGLMVLLGTLLGPLIDALATHMK
ncbi:MAG: hypothetical protein GYA36_21190 [Veillonellaceae bacterium]|nr:hypothetical protein [Veillonellaceae bacterium]